MMNDGGICRLQQRLSENTIVSFLIRINSFYRMGKASIFDKIKLDSHCRFIDNRVFLKSITFLQMVQL